MEIFCINSVKGGSGKTTVSLAILYNRAMSYMTAAVQKSEYSSPKRFAYVDIDLQGTGVSRLIYKEDERDKIKFYNDFDSSKDTYLDYRNIFSDGESVAKREAIIEIDAYLLNDSDDAKTLYGVKNTEMLEKRNINRFKEKAIAIIDQIINSNEYDMVVLDNAPSYDYISAGIFEHICQMYNKSNNRIVNAFVTTLEKSQVYTTISKVSNILRKTEYNLGIHIICNDIHGYFDSAERDKKKFQEDVFRQVEGTSDEIKGKKVSPISFDDKDDGFNDEKIVIMERLDICNKFVFGEENTLNQEEVMNKLISDNLRDDMKLSV